MTDTINQRMSAADWVILLTLGVLWGGSFFFVEIIVEEMPPLTLVAVRLVIAAAALNLFMKFKGVPMPKDAVSWRSFVIMGMINSIIPYSLFSWGQIHISGGLASILNASTPLLTVIVAHIMTTDEKVTGGKIAGVVMGIIGVAVMIGPDALQGLGAAVLAQAACLAASLSYAFAGVFGRRFRRMGLSPTAAATGQITAAALILFPIAMIVDQPWHLPMPSLASWASLAGLALLCTSWAYILFFRLLNSAGATNISLVTFLVPISAILLGAVVLGERLEPVHFAGIALIGIGLACIDGRLIRRLRPSSLGNQP